MTLTQSPVANPARPGLLAAAILAAALSAGASHATTVMGTDDIYNLSGSAFEGTTPAYLDVTGLTQISFSVSTGATVTVNGGNYNDADGIGSVSGEHNTGTSILSGITAPTAGFLAGAFVSDTLGAAPSAIDFTGAGGTSFSSLSPTLQQTFFIGDGLDGSGATQVFYVPTGATKLYLGLTDACGYNGGPSCYNDNSGSFTVTASGIDGGGGAGGVPEPASWALMLTGFAGLGATLRSRRAARLQAA